MSRHGARRGPNSPFVLDVSELGRKPGSMVTLHETVPSPARIGVELLAIAKGAPITLDLRLESVSDGVLVSGTASAPTEGECARCLTPVTDHVDIDLAEFFAYPDSEIEAEAEEDEVGHVVYDAAGDTVDIEQQIIDAVGLALPFSPLCRDDCPGLCPECGVQLASAEPGHHHDVIDPRWAKLAAIIPTEEEEPTAGGSE
ncbi:MAG: DUF177 domain-containing protein [Mycobacterium sp.]